jgi:hypothetical protein
VISSGAAAAVINDRQSADSQGSASTGVPVPIDKSLGGTDPVNISGSLPPASFAASVAAASRTTASSASSAPSASAVGFAAALEKVALPASDATRFAPNDRSTLSYLTPADRELIQAATGFVISSDGVVQNPVPGKSVDNFVSQLAMDRYNGKLTGEVTAGYLKEQFAKYSGPAAGNSAFDQAYLDAALSFLEARDRRRAEDSTPRSSFNVGL